LPFFAKLSIAFLVLFAASLSIHAQPTDTELKTLEARLESIATTDLRDFAPEAFEAATANARALRAMFDREGRVPEVQLRETQQELSKTETAAKRTRETIGKAYGLRNAAAQLNFIRAFDPAAVYRAEKSYREALQLAAAGMYDQARRRANESADQFRTLRRAATARSKRQLSANLARYRTAIAADLAALDAPSGTDQVMARVRPIQPPFRSGTGPLDRATIGEPPYYPEPPDPAGPRPPIAPLIDNRAATSLHVSWFDGADNETGSRVLRTTDQETWQIATAIGPVPKFEEQSYTDTGLEPDTRYCYVIEAFSGAGARRSQMRCANTRDGNNIDVWRLQLRVKVADLANADLDDPLGVRLGTDYPSSTTVLDYGHDDFERGSNFVYDLNLGSIAELGDITALSVFDTANSEDLILIEEISLLVNNTNEEASLSANNPSVVFTRTFGATSASVLRLEDGYHVTQAELRAHPAWQAFVAKWLSDQTFKLPPVSSAGENGIQVDIPVKQIVSRIESLVGHLIHTDAEIGDRFKWGFVHGPAVEVSRSGASVLHVDLDLEATIENWDNPELDLDFDIAMARRCTAGTPDKVTIALTSQNFTSNVDFALWKDITSLGVMKGVDKLIDWYAKDCVTPPQIEQTFEVNLPPGIDCSALQLEVQPQANVTLCCFRLF
jgi:hypothetical protein